MTRGRELDAIVCKEIMGGEVFNWPYDRDGLGENRRGIVRALPPYSTDRAHALEVVHEMLNKSDPVRDQFLTAVKFVATKALSSHEVQVWSESIDPLQICLEALRAVGKAVFV